jgi:hypothetical protein
LLPVDREVAEHHLIFKQWNAKRGSRTTEIDDRASVWLARSPGAYADYLKRGSPEFGPGTGPARTLAGERVVHIVNMVDTEAYRTPSVLTGRKRSPS